MVTDAYGLLLQELGKLLNIKNLQPDTNNSCLIKFPGEPSIQIELDKSHNNLMLCCNFGAVPPGRYRENVFREALKSNGLPPPHHGDFAYSKKTDNLIMIELLPITELNGDKVFNALAPFREKAKNWHESISRGEIPSTLQGAYSRGGSGMFGLK